MITEETTKPYIPVQGVIIYKKYSNYYLETHDILSDGKEYRWQEGKSFEKEHLKELSIALGNNAFKPIEIKGLMPSNILYLKQSFFNLSLAWYLPPSKRMLHFKKELKLAAGIISLPGLIFCVEDKELIVVAVKGKSKPNLKTSLFKAPFHNIHATASVCLGNTSDTKPKETIEAEMLRW
jgi:PRTRC genetic system protein B